MLNTNNGGVFRKLEIVLDNNGMGEGCYCDFISIGGLHPSERSGDH